jgi:hypothetical protein
MLHGRILSALTDELRRPEYRGDCPVRGHCYVASEALFHLSGGKAAGWNVYRIRHEGTVHWFLRDPRGDVVDLTAGQFRQPVPYAQATHTGFLTLLPSKRAQIVIGRVTR